MALMTITQFMTGIKNWVMGKIENITALIPSQASSSNKLADKAFVNSSIATATATFRGSYNVVSDLSLSYNATHAQIQTALATKMSALSITPDNNDYAFVQIPTADATPTQIAKIEKYKYNGTAWAFEYELNNSGFTASQWAAINSGATLELIGKLQALPTNAELTTLLAGKQNVLTFDNVPTQNSDNPVKSGGIYSAIATAISNATNAIKEWANGLFAKTNGWYKQLTAGLAENLVSPDGVTNTEPYLFRTSAGSTSIGSGYAQLKKLEGRTVKWNQKIQRRDTITVSGDTTHVSAQKQGNGVKIVISGTISGTETNIMFASSVITLEANHKYYITYGCDSNTKDKISYQKLWWYCGNEAYVAGNSRVYQFAQPTDLKERISVGPNLPAGTYYVCPFVVDLTELGIESEITSPADFESWLATNIGLKSYYPYTESKLVSVDIDGLETTGFNQWDEEWELGTLNVDTGEKTDSDNTIRSKNYIPVFASTNYCVTYTAAVVASNEVRVFYYDNNKSLIDKSAYIANGTVITTPQNCKYILFIEAHHTTYNHDICLNLSLSGYRNGEYEAYWKEKLDLSWIKSLKDTNDNVLFPYGLLSVGSVKDEITGSKAIKRVGVVDLGTLTWAYSNTTNGFYATLSGCKAVPDESSIANVICARYQSKNCYDIITLAKTGVGIDNVSRVRIHDDNYSDPTAFKTVMSGVMLYYELATPIEVDIDPEANMYYKVDDWGTEEFTSDSEDVPQTVAPYHTTHYMDNLRDKLRNIDTNFVSATEEQTFTDEQKAQARKNIGAGTVNANDDCPNLVAGLAKNLIDTKGTGTEQMFTRRTSCGEESIKGDGNALFKKLLGKSLVWNQLVNNGNFSIGGTGWTVVRGTTNIASGVCEITLTDSPITNYSTTIGRSVLFQLGHKYYVSVSCKCPHSGTFRIDTNGVVTSVVGSVVENVWGKISDLRTAVRSSSTTLNLYPLELTDGYVQGDTYSIKNVQIFDLTLMFGVGNEPSTVEEFEAMYNKLYYAYNDGKIIDNMVESYETVGFNQWDEEWELGSIDNFTGQNETSTTAIRCKNFIPVFGGMKYYIKAPQNSIIIFAYDVNKTYIGTYNSGQFLPNRGATWAAGVEATLPQNAAFIRIKMGNGYGTTYNHDICINLSWSGYRNGEYEPYWKRSLALGLNSFRVTDGTDIITVNGLKSVGNVYDEIDLERKKYIKRVDTVDLGKLTWSKGDGPRLTATYVGDEKVITNNDIPNAITPYYMAVKSSTSFNTANKVFAIVYDEQASNFRIIIADSSYSDAATFKTAMNGVPMYYELATPIEYDLVDDWQATCQVADFGTEYAAPTEEVDANGVPKSAPFHAMIKYNDDFVRGVVRMPQTYQSQESMDAFAAMLGTALNGTITKTWDSSNGKWTYTFTPNSSNE